MYHFTYKCRLCGETFTQRSAKQKEDAITVIEELTWANRRETSVPLHEVHLCEEDIGIADIIGAKFTPEK